MPQLSYNVIISYFQFNASSFPAGSELHYTLKNVVCIAHQNWCVRLVQTGTRYMVCCAHPFYGVHSTLNLVCYAHHFWCGKHTLYGVLLHCILPRARFYTCKYV